MRSLNTIRPALLGNPLVSPRPFLSLLCAVTLSACGGGGSSPEPDPTPRSVENAALKRADSESMTDHLQAALRQHIYNHTYPLLDEPVILPVVTVNASTETTAAASADSSQYSGTNNQIENVNEADIVQYDGRYAYLMKSDGDVRVMQFDGASATEITTIDLSGNNATLDLHTTENQSTLIGISRTYQNVYPFSTSYYPIQSGITSHIELIDVTEPTLSSRRWSLEFDGQIIDTRRIDEHLYVVSKYYPSLPNRYAMSDTAFEQGLENLDVNTLLPNAHQNQQALSWLAPDDCYIPNDNANAHESGYYEQPAIVTISVINIDNPEERSNLCVVTHSARTFMSQNALYLHASVYSDSGEAITEIHKFALTADNDAAAVEYRGSGYAPGTTYSRDYRPSFRFGEKDGALMVVTTDDRGFWIANGAAPDPATDDWDHKLVTLRESTTDVALEVVSSLPNDAQPAAIGKPNEAIYSVRFMGDRAYIVTFKKVDPLYVIDVANPDEPSILGELEIPGFSDYLHPITDDLLLGIGKDTEDQGSFAWFQGLRIALFDVSEPSSPVQAGLIQLGGRGSDTAVSDNHKAFSILNGTNGITRAALPVSIYSESAEGGSRYGDFLYQGLHLIEIDTEAKTLSSAGDIISRTDTDYYYYYPPRSILTQGSSSSNNDNNSNNINVHYIEGENVWSAPWEDPANALGPQ